jgi:hypothetical protein
MQQCTQHYGRWKSWASWSGDAKRRRCPHIQRRHCFDELAGSSLLRWNSSYRGNHTRNHHREVKNYVEYQDLLDHIKVMMLQAIPTVYTGALAHAQLGYANATRKEGMTHLLTKNGDITERDLVENTKLLKAPWDPDTSIATLPRVCHRRIGPHQQCNLHSDPREIFDQAGVFENAVEVWERNPRPKRLWTTSLRTSRQPMNTI